MWLRGGIGVVGVVGLLMAFWIIGSIATDLVERLRRIGGVRTGLLHRARLIPRSIVGMQLAHLGIAVFILGVTLVKTGEVERDVRMQVGDTTTIGDLVFAFGGVREVQGPNYRAARGTVAVTDKGRPVVTLHPEKRLYPATQIDHDRGRHRRRPHPRPLRLARRAGRRRRLDRARLRQALRRLDLGRLPVMALGGLLAASDRRYRAKVRRTAETTTSVASAA